MEKDYIIRAIAGNGQIRAFVADTRNLTEYARSCHNTSPVVTAALGRMLTAGALMGCMMKNDNTWKNNNRVKTLEFYYNDKYICELSLDDVKSPQYFDLGKYNLHADSGEEVVFKYVIKDVYKGDKYDDTAITGIIMDFDTPNH